MLARLAENLFWAGRYVERAEDVARVLDVTFHALLEEPGADTAEAWRNLLAALSQLSDFEATGQPFDDEAVPHFLVLDGSNPGSIASSVRSTRENVRSLREQVSAELWEAVNGLYLEVRGRDLAADLRTQQYALYGMVRQRCQTIGGVADETMPRTEGWRFLVLGRNLERAIMGVRLLSVESGTLDRGEELGFHQWRRFLRAASAFEAYSRSRRGVMSAEAALDFVLLDADFPRSVAYCLREAETQLDQLESPDPASPSRRALGRVRADLEFSEWVDRHGPARGRFLTELITGVQHAIDVITEEFFVPARPGEYRAFETT